MWYRLMSKHESEWPYGIPKRDGKEGRWQASMKQSMRIFPIQEIDQNLEAATSPVT